MGTVFINDQEVEVGPKDNLVQAASRAGVEIPHYCWHHDLSVVASCRMCLVEVGEKKPDGTVAMLPRLVPACQTPAKPGTVVRTDTPKVKTSQEQTLEFLLLNHPLDCSICDQAGECYLQDYTYKYGRAHSRLQEPKVHREDKYHIGDQIALFTDRCVMCTRCVRFTREISGTSELHVINRGSVEEIDVFPGRECNNKLAGNVVDLCPVGALCSKDFLYKKRVWWLKSASSVCNGCSTGCSIHVDQNENKVYRLRPRENPEAQGSFMCDDGRFGWKYLNDEHRINRPRVSNTSAAASSNTQELQFADPWPAALQAAKESVQNGIRKGGNRYLGILSPFMTCEEAYLVASFLKGTDKQIVLALGHVPVVGEDDCYPKGIKGKAPEADNVKFTIRAEKCPNRRGVEAVLKHFQGSVIVESDWSQRIGNGEIDGVFFVGGYAHLAEKEIYAKIASVESKVVVDFLENGATQGAQVVLSSAAFAERSGTYINAQGLAQEFHSAIRPPEDARQDGRIFMELCGRKGLYQAEAIRQEMASKIPAFSKFGNGVLPELGMKVFQ